jgi:predicted HAD superfamily phosphohydrolase YqeG
MLADGVVTRHAVFNMRAHKVVCACVHALIIRLQVPAAAAVMIGDDVCDDVGGAMACGMAGVLGELATPQLQFPVFLARYLPVVSTQLATPASLAAAQ